MNDIVMMQKKLFTLYLTTCSVLASAQVNLKCSSTRSEDSCRCGVIIDPLTNFPVYEAVCQYLELEDFPALGLLGSINSLDLAHNNLKELRKLHDIPSQNAEPIFILKLSHNSIVDVDDTFFIDNFRNITTLDMSYNNITVLRSALLFNKLDSLEVLNLSFNQIENIQDGIFSNLKNLRRLDLSYNPIYNILQDPTALIDKLGINENIVELNLNNIGAIRIHGKWWNRLKKIEHLSIADNPLNKIPQTSATLKYLDISGTNITDIHENYLKYSNLIVLKMSRMENLTSVPKYALFNLGNLEEFSLTDCAQLQDFNALSFGHLGRRIFPRYLKKFDLARNRLSTLNETYQYLFHKIEHVDLSFNTWKCNCDVLWMQELDNSIQRRSYMRCASPSDAENKQVLKLQPLDLPECHPQFYGKKFHETTFIFMTMLVLGLILITAHLCVHSTTWSNKFFRSRVSPVSPYSINSEHS